MPDRKVKWSKYSNPTGYISYISTGVAHSPRTPPGRTLADAAPIPPFQATAYESAASTGRKIVKKITVTCSCSDHQGNPDLPVVLTTLAARNYHGEASVSNALSAILNGIAEEIAFSDSRRTRVLVLDPR